VAVAADRARARLRASALVGAVSFELFEEGVDVGGAPAVGIGLAAGALVCFVLARPSA
jgi:hypothetical protein